MNNHELLELTKTHFKNNYLKLFTSKEVDAKIDEAISLMYTGTRKDKLSTLKLAGRQFISNLFSRTKYVTVNDYNLEDVNLFYMCDIKDYEIKSSIIEKYKSGSNNIVSSRLLPSSPISCITITSTLYDDAYTDYDLMIESRFGWRTIALEDKESLLLHPRNFPLIEALATVGLIELKRDKTKLRKNKKYKPTPEYRINPKYFVTLIETTIEDDRTEDKLTKINDRLRDTYGIGIEENMVEALNLHNLINLDFDKADMYRYVHTHYPVGSNHKGTEITNDRIKVWVEWTMAQIERFKDNDSMTLPKINGNRYRTFHWFNSIPKPCRNFLVSISGLVERDATSMHWNNAVKAFYATAGDLMNEATEYELELLVESQGDAKTFFADKLSMDRKEFGDRINKFLYFKNSDALNSKLGKWIFANMPTFYEWCRVIKETNKKEMVKLLYPMEYEFITELKMRAYKHGIEVITCHDAVMIKDDRIEAFKVIEEEVMNDLDILAEMNTEEIPEARINDTYDDVCFNEDDDWDWKSEEDVVEDVEEKYTISLMTSYGFAIDLPVDTETYFKYKHAERKEKERMRNSLRNKNRI